MSLLRLSFLLLLVVASGCGGATNQAPAQAAASLPTATPSPITTPQAPEKLDQARLIEKDWVNASAYHSRSVSETHDGHCPYDISAEYPQLNVLGRDAKIFNRWIRQKVLADVARFRRLELRAESQFKNTDKPAMREALELSFTIYYVNKRLISLRLTHDVMAAGQMHPIAYYETINYDLHSQRQLQPADVFRSGYLRVFSRYSRDWLRQTYRIPNDH